MPEPGFNPLKDKPFASSKSLEDARQSAIQTSRDMDATKAKKAASDKRYAKIQGKELPVEGKVVKTGPAVDAKFDTKKPVQPVGAKPIEASPATKYQTEQPKDLSARAQGTIDSYGGRLPLDEMQKKQNIQDLRTGKKLEPGTKKTTEEKAAVAAKFDAAREQTAAAPLKTPEEVEMEAVFEQSEIVQKMVKELHTQEKAYAELSGFKKLFGGGQKKEITKLLDRIKKYAPGFRDPNYKKAEREASYKGKAKKQYGSTAPEKTAAVQQAADQFMDKLEAAAPQMNEKQAQTEIKALMNEYRQTLKNIAALKDKRFVFGKAEKLSALKLKESKLNSKVYGLSKNFDQRDARTIMRDEIAGVQERTVTAKLEGDKLAEAMLKQAIDEERKPYEMTLEEKAAQPISTKAMQKEFADDKEKIQTLPDSAIEPLPDKMPKVSQIGPIKEKTPIQAKEIPEIELDEPEEDKGTQYPKMTAQDMERAKAVAKQPAATEQHGGLEKEPTDDEIQKQIAEMEAQIGTGEENDEAA